ncbi:tyrosine-type recombinase/integrase [Nocardioides jishulii]|uniref:Phage integrase family protein n=1 Tax=Nocardioides jishulii TaxID=2575440 RepID=A0A4U2YUF5_9ACTN|nr:tyrosine-type recombinase/integrase [Nocardioides jishulii]QCX26424.1 phage integrase family protein [Nocardioides jishulii]TKI63771.1 phage integrase family protein [Nocardioides jishulii]
MGRPKALPWTLGTIKFAPHPTRDKAVQARGSYRNDNGQRKDVTASGGTEAAARRALQTKVNAARDEFQGGDDVLQSSTTVERAAAVWLDWKSREHLRASTLGEYAGYVRKTIKGSALAGLPLTEANNVARIEAWLAAVADERGGTAASQARKVLGGVLQLAERRGAIPASVMHRVKTPNPKPGSVGDRKCRDEDCDLDCGKRHLDTERAFTAAEAIKVQAVADASRADLGDLAAFLFGTGARISEALHCTAWSGVDLGAQTVRVRGTKTANADRMLSLSDDLVERLSDRAGLHGTEGLVFGTTRYASKAGEPRNTNNVLKSLRTVFANAGVPWAGSHTFRRTVATWMDEAGAPLAEIANQLGHADVNVTAGYLGRTAQPTRAASIMVLPAIPDSRSLVTRIE